MLYAEPGFFRGYLLIIPPSLPIPRQNGFQPLSYTGVKHTLCHTSHPHICSMAVLNMIVTLPHVDVCPAVAIALKAISGQRLVDQASPRLVFPTASKMSRFITPMTILSLFRMLVKQSGVGWVEYLVCVGRNLLGLCLSFFNICSTCVNNFGE